MPMLRNIPRLALFALLGLGPTMLGGCDAVNDLIASISPPADPSSIVAPAMGKLKDGDLPGAMSEYESIVAAHPDVAEAHIGLAYVQMLAGKYDKADSTLKTASDIEGLEDGVKNEISLRRALVALRAGDLENTQKYGEASGLPAGQVIAAEVYLADAESESAIPLLEKARDGGSGSVKAAAQTYLDYLGDQETGRAMLAEATALWALGQRADACETAEELLRFLPPDFADRDRLLLLWAGRAVASGQPGVAEGLLDDMGGAPEDQVWRVQATRALIAVANEDYDGGKEIFTALGSGGAPADGLADALATAAAISGDASFAQEIAGGLESAAVARGLLAAGADGAAKSAAPSSSMLSSYLEKK